MKAPVQEHESRELVPAGTHMARCYAVVDLGTQDVQYPGKSPSTQRQLLLQWEIPALREEFTVDGVMSERPRSMYMVYTFSSYHKATLAQHVIAWTGQCGDGFDYETLLSRPCMLSVVHQQKKQSDGVYAKIAGVMKVPTGSVVPELERAVAFYDLIETGRNFPESIMEPQYKWVREKIEKSEEFRMMESAKEVLAEQGFTEQEVSQEIDDIPFSFLLPFGIFLLTASSFLI